MTKVKKDTLFIYPSTANVSRAKIKTTKNLSNALDFAICTIFYSRSSDSKISCSFVFPFYKGNFTFCLFVIFLLTIGK